MSMSWARSGGNRDRILMGASLEGEVDNAPAQVYVSEAGGASGSGKSAGRFRQIAVGIDVDDVGGAVGGEANVQAPVVAQLHRSEPRPRDGRDARLDLRGQSGAAHGLRSPILCRCLVPLRLER